MENIKNHSLFFKTDYIQNDLDINHKFLTIKKQAKKPKEQSELLCPEA